MPLLVQAVLEPTPSSGHIQMQWGGAVARPPTPTPAPAQPPAEPKVQRGHGGTCDLQQDCLRESGPCSKSSSGGPPGCPLPGFSPCWDGPLHCTKEKTTKKNLSPKLKSTSRKILQEVLFLAQLGLACCCILPLNRNCRGGHLCFLSKLRVVTTPSPALGWELGVASVRRVGSARAT